MRRTKRILQTLILVILLLGLTGSVSAADTLHIGDVNGDGEVDGRDAVCLMKFLAGETDENGQAIQIDETNADLNKDGNVDEKDLLQLVKSLGGEEAGE